MEEKKCVRKFRDRCFVDPGRVRLGACASPAPATTATPKSARHRCGRCERQVVQPVRVGRHPKSAKEFGWDTKFIEIEKQPTDYEKNIDQFATEKYDVIVTVGFLMAINRDQSQAVPPTSNRDIDNAYFPPKASLLR